MGKTQAEPRKFFNIRAICPYYKGEFTRHPWRFLECHGVLPSSPTVRHKFRGDREVKRVYRRYCSAEWRTCPVARLIEEREK